MASARQRFLAAEDEDELMALQEQMEKSQATPSATVKRIQRKPAEEPAQIEEQHSCTDPHCSHTAHHHHHHQSHGANSTSTTPSVDDLMAAMQNEMKGIVGEVQERTVESTTQPPLPPTVPPSTASAPIHAAFPAALHRKQSKFSLARQGKEVHSTSKRVSFGSTTSTSSPGVPTAGGGGLPPPPPTDFKNVTEAESIAAETTAVINAMSPEQLEAAREEVLSRLPPSAAEFLRKRGAQKAAAAAAIAKEVVPAEESSPNNVVSTETLSNSNTKTKAATTKTALATTTSSPSFQPDLSATTTNPSSTSSITPAQLRFNVTGNVVSLKPLQLITNTALDSLEVVSRDPLRQSDSEIQGYTIEEACVLVRSTVFQQRVFALRLLRAVLLRSKPTNRVFTTTETTSPDREELVNLENIISNSSEEKENQKPLPKLYWIDIWRHALHDAKIPLVLRVAFDDQQAVVVTAAAEALAVLLSLGQVERKFYSLGDANPLVSWPMVSLRHMQRPNTSGSHWIAAPVDLKARRERKAAARAARISASNAAGRAPEEDDEQETSDDIDEKELARVDPLTGLLNMELVERIGYVLGVLRPPGASMPCLAILENICYAGQDAAKKVVETPSVLDAVVKVLQRFEEKSNNNKKKNNEEGEENRKVEADVFKLQALRVLRILCQISPLSARAVATYPVLLASAVFPVFLKQQIFSSFSSRQRETLFEALQIWRCLALYGLHIGISADDAYPALCLLMNPTMSSTSLEDVEEKEARQWEISREVYHALAQVEGAKTFQTFQEESVEFQWISKECSSSIAQQTLEWVCSLPLEDLFSALHLQNGENNSKNTAAALVVMSAVSAALYFLGTNYSTSFKSSNAEEVESRAAADDFSSKKEAALTLLTNSGIISSRNLTFLLSSSLTTCLEAPVSTTTHTILTSYASFALSLARLEAVLTRGVVSTPAAAALLAPFASPAAAHRLSELSNSVDSTLLQPWDMPVMQSCLELSRCIAAAAGGGSCFACFGSGDGEGADAALTALQALPPGAEDTALQLMAHCLSSSQLQQTVDAAFDYLGDNKNNLSPLVGGGGGGDAHGDVFGEDLPLKPSVETMGKVLLAGYAATHLGFVQEGEEEGNSDDNGALSSSISASSLASLCYSQALLRPETGSTLPLSRVWPLQASPTPPPGSNVSAPASLATAYALLWSLGITALEKRETAAKCADMALKEDIKAAVMLIFDREELLQEERDGFSVEDEEIWREPLVRWSFSALLQHNITNLITTTSTNSRTTSSIPVDSYKSYRFTIPEAKRLIDGYSSSSFGDPLFGIAVALLFHKAFSTLEVQLDALMSLVDGKSLHLLPSVDRCLGDCFSYLDPPVLSASNENDFLPPSISTNTGAVSNNGGGALSDASSQKDAGQRKEERENKAAMDTYLQILTTPEALKCVESDSIALSLVIHRLAKFIFKCVKDDDGEEESFVDFEKKENGSLDTYPTDLEKLKCSALLCSAIRRLAASKPAPQPAPNLAAEEVKEKVGFSRGLQILSMLLRWSCREGRASDVVSAPRMEFIQQACGTDASGVLLNTIMAALHA